MVGILGKKLGMTQVYDDTGKLVPVTLIEAGPCYVLQVKTKENDGYTALQLGYGSKKEKHTTKPEAGHFKKAGVDAVRYVKELRVKDVTNFKAGQKVEADIFTKGDYVDVVGISIGKGFQGGVRRWGWKGGPGGHGSMFHRAVGSIQSGARLGRVTKGHHMPGHMGVDTVTIQNLEVVMVNKDESLLVVKGAIPGHKNNFVMVREARKRPKGFVKQKPVAIVTKKKSVKAQQAAAKK
jgi:large subunit ribosomal protein L3